VRKKERQSAKPSFISSTCGAAPVDRHRRAYDLGAMRFLCSSQLVWPEAKARLGRREAAPGEVGDIAERMKDEAAKPRHSRAVIPGQAGSNRVKPNQTCGGVDVSRNWTCGWPKRLPEYSPVKPGQSQSNPVQPSPTQTNLIKIGKDQGLAPPGTVKPNQTKSNQIKPARRASPHKRILSL
jgi:hypothetical protein